MLTARECGGRMRRARVATGITREEAMRRLRLAGLNVATRDLEQVEKGGRVLAWNRLISWVEALGYDPAIVAPELLPKGGGT